jgi:hypothetical protein
MRARQAIRSRSDGGVRPFDVFRRLLQRLAIPNDSPRPARLRCEHRGTGRTPFYLSRNECEVAPEKPEQGRIVESISWLALHIR